MPYVRENIPWETSSRGLERAADLPSGTIAPRNLMRVQNHDKVNDYSEDIDQMTRQQLGESDAYDVDELVDEEPITTNEV
jgi:hypothetical protein